jgi:hypothetical protein
MVCSAQAKASQAAQKEQGERGAYQCLKRIVRVMMWNDWPSCMKIGFPIGDCDR